MSASPVLRRLALLAALAAAGIAVDLSGVVDWRAALAFGRAHAHDWALPLLIVAAQVVLFTFGQPGSLLFWPAALLYPPATATLILTAGATAGALGAYGLARRVTRVEIERLRGGRLFRMLEREGDFLTLLGLRVLPGMPHSALNYAAGVLGLPLARFAVASALGLAVKSYLYAGAISEVLASAGPASLLRFEVLAPMLAISLLALAGRLVHRR